MKRAVLLGLLLGAGCVPNSNSTENSQSTTARTIDLIKAGDGKACSQEDVRNMVISEVKPKDSDKGFYDLGDYQAGQNLISYNIDTIAVGGVDKSINSLACDANVIIHYKDHDDKTFSIRYVLRPSVEDPSGFIINTTAEEALQYARSAASDAASSISQSRAQAAEAQRQQQANEQQAAQPAPIETPNEPNEESNSPPTDANTSN